MSSTYKTRAGDTFATISRINYGTEADEDLIRKGNPGVEEPLTAGLDIFIPTSFIFNKFEFQLGQAGDDLDEVVLFAGGRRFRFWTQIKVSLSIDSVSTFSLTAPTDAITDVWRGIFKPFSYAEVIITIGGENIFQGVMVSVVPDLSKSGKILQVSGYSKPGVLDDCPPPASLFPLEFNGQNLEAIAETLCKPFGIGVEFLNEPGPIFETVAIKPGKKILSFLAGLAKQRNLIISSNPIGDLVFLRSTETGNPVARLAQGVAPLLEVRPSFDPQQYYSDITGISDVEMGSDGAQYTVKNDKLKGVLRPFTFVAEDVSDSELKTAVEAKMGRMFANMAAYAAGVSTLRDPQGFLWAPNTTLTLLAVDAMIYVEYEFIIRGLDFNITRDAKTAAMQLILPGSFSGEIPEALPWDV